jgi:hypothetical protein
VVNSHPVQLDEVGKAIAKFRLALGTFEFEAAPKPCACIWKRRLYEHAILEHLSEQLTRLRDTGLSLALIVSVCGTFENLMRENARIFSSESYAARMRPIAKWPHSQKILWLCCKMPAYACRMPHTHIPHTETMLALLQSRYLEANNKVLKGRAKTLPGGGKVCKGSYGNDPNFLLFRHLYK